MCLAVAATGAALGHAQAGSDSSCDADGSLVASYDDIPNLQCTGTCPQDTYQEYLQGRSDAAFSTTLVYVSPGGNRSARATKALVLVDSSLYGGILSNLTRYASDLESGGYTVEIHQISGGTPLSLKQFITDHATDAAGCVFVGDLPAAWFEETGAGTREQFPCDLYYMDLDGTWTDGDADGVFDGHAAGSGDEGPEIFVGRIDASMMSGDEASTTNAYLDKNHCYRIGVHTPSGHALSYTEDGWVWFMDMRTDISYAYPSFDDVTAPATNRDDYVDNRLPSTAYDFIQLCCHSTSTTHDFARGGSATSTDIQSALPHATFYNLHGCSAMRWTIPDYLGGSYIYDASPTSLAVIGSTKPGSMLTFYAFYQPLGAGACFGEAYRQWFDYIAPYDVLDTHWHFGMTIAGDPFLELMERALYLEFPEDLPSGHQPPGPDVPVSIEIQAGFEAYAPGTGFVYYRFDPADPFTPVALDPLGGDLFEAVILGPRPGDLPEFYFTAAGDGGTTVTSPPDAPTTVHSFDVCLVETLFRDDFESDQGWTVENISLTDGAWERAVPHPTSGLQYAPHEDNPNGTGTYCFITGSGPPGAHHYDFEVDGGPTRLISPTIDLSAGSALVHAHNWYGTMRTHDPFEIDVSNDDGLTWTNVHSSVYFPGKWEVLSFDVQEYVAPTSQVRVRYSARDRLEPNVVEAGLDDFAVERRDYSPELYATAYAVSAADGCELDLLLDAGPAHAGQGYLLLAGRSGSAPGMDVGGLHIPLNWDCLTALVLDHLGMPVFQGFSGTLDGQGETVVDLDLPASLLSLFPGETLTFAFVVLSPLDLASNAIDVRIE